MKITVYIASPYRNGNKLNNVRRQIDAAEELLKHGFAPHVPLLNHFWDEIYPHDENVWLELDLEFLGMFDCLLRLDGESIGADKEVERAKLLGIPVFYDIKVLMLFYANFKKYDKYDEEGSLWDFNELDIRTERILKENGITTVTELLNTPLTLEDFKKMKGCGRLTAERISKILIKLKRK